MLGKASDVNEILQDAIAGAALLTAAGAFLGQLLFPSLGSRRRLASAKLVVEGYEAEGLAKFARERVGTTVTVSIIVRAARDLRDQPNGLLYAAVERRERAELKQNAPRLFAAAHARL